MTMAAFSRASTIHEETIGHYERGEARPNEGMVQYMAEQLGLKGKPGYITLIAAAEHDRQLWDAPKVAAAARAAPPPSPQPAAIAAPLPTPTLSALPSRTRRRGVWDLMRIVAVLVGLMLILVLVVNAQRASFPTRPAAVVATLTRAVTATSIPTATHVPTATPTNLPTATPTQAPTATTTPIAIATPTSTPTRTPTGSLTWTFRGPGPCDWNEVIQTQGWSAHAHLVAFASANGYGCDTGQQTHYQGGYESICDTNQAGSCTRSTTYPSGQPAGDQVLISAFEPIGIGSYRYVITNNWASSPTVTVGASNG